MKVLFDRRRFNVLLSDIRTTNIIGSSVLLCVFYFLWNLKNHTTVGKTLMQQSCTASGDLLVLLLKQVFWGDLVLCICLFSLSTILQKWCNFI